MANGNGDRLTWRTVMVIIAIGSPIAGLSVGGYMLREQVKINVAQEAQLREMERDSWHLEQDVKELREDLDRLILDQSPRKDRMR